MEEDSLQRNAILFTELDENFPPKKIPENNVVVSLKAPFIIPNDKHDKYYSIACKKVSSIPLSLSHAYI